MYPTSHEGPVFGVRLAIMIGCIALLAFLNAAVPPLYSPVKVLLSVVQLAFSAAAVILTVKYVLEDF